MITFGSLFSGIGGFDLGFERAGMECRWQVEIDSRCRHVLRRHFQGTNLCEDVHDVRSTEFVRPDVICGGFPCQDLSVAGRRAGLAGERSGLWWEFHRILAEFCPRWVCIENVPGLLSSNGGRDMGTLLGALGELGYGWAYRVLDAQWFGVPQRRRRVFIVGCLGDWRRSAEVLFEREGLPWDTPPRREARSDVAQTISPSTQGRGNSSGGRNGGYPINPVAFGGNNTKGAIDVATACNAKGSASGRKDFESETFVMQERMEAEGETNGPGGKGWSDGVAFTMEARSRPQSVAYQCHGSNVGPMGSLRSGNGNESGGVPFVASFAENQRHELREEAIAPQLSCSGGKPGMGYSAARIGMAVRRLTPIECERLQGFPDRWTEFGVDENGVRVEVSDSSRYRMLGNAVAVPVSEWIGRRIVESFDAD